MNYLFSAIFLGGLTLWLIDRWAKYTKASAQVADMPKQGIMFGLLSPIGMSLPYIPYISSGALYPWFTKRSVFERVGSEVFGMLSLFPTVGAICVSDMEAVKKNNRLVWTTATGFVDDLLESWAPGTPIYVHDACEELTLSISLCVIAKAGFGQAVHWKDDASPPTGHQLTFKQSLVLFSENIILPMLMPSWAWGLRKHWRLVKQANDELRVYIQEMIRSRRESQHQDPLAPAEQKHDLFSQLVDARDSDEMLSEDELIGNVLIFLLAGLETTAHALAMMLGLIALYPEEQARLVQQIKEIQGARTELTYDDMRKLTYATAILYETLRLYPAGPIIPKFATENTTLVVGSQVHQVPASTHAFIFTCGLHYNPAYWDDPYDFVPSRFIDTNWNRDAFIPFSLGPRACMGRRFAETEAVAALVRLLSKYQVSVDEARFKSIPSEPMVERRERFMKPTFKLTLAPAAFPLVLTPRL